MHGFNRVDVKDEHCVGNRELGFHERLYRFNTCTSRTLIGNAGKIISIQNYDTPVFQCWLNKSVHMLGSVVDEGCEFLIQGHSSNGRRFLDQFAPLAVGWFFGYNRRFARQTQRLPQEFDLCGLTSAINSFNRDQNPALVLVRVCQVHSVLVIRRNNPPAVLFYEQRFHRSDIPNPIRFMSTKPEEIW